MKADASLLGASCTSPFGPAIRQFQNDPVVLVVAFGNKMVLRGNNR